MIGQCGITTQEFNNEQVPEIGFLLAFDYWHHGYDNEVATALKEYDLNILRYKHLNSIIRDNNIVSQNVALRNGMKPFGTKTVFYRGATMPQIVYRLCR